MVNMAIVMMFFDSRVDRCFFFFLFMKLQALCVYKFTIDQERKSKTDLISLDFCEDSLIGSFVLKVA